MDTTKRKEFNYFSYIEEKIKCKKVDKCDMMMYNYLKCSVFKSNCMLDSVKMKINKCHHVSER